MNHFRLLFTTSVLIVAVGVAMVALHAIGLHSGFVFLGLLSTLVLIFSAQYLALRFAGLGGLANSAETPPGSSMDVDVDVDVAKELEAGLRES